MSTAVAERITEETETYAFRARPSHQWPSHERPDVGEWRRRSAATRSRPRRFRKQEKNWDEVENLLSHFADGQAMALEAEPGVDLEVGLEADLGEDILDDAAIKAPAAEEAHQSKAERRHRPMALSIPRLLMSSIVFGLLVALLWLHGTTQALGRQDAELQKGIVAAREDVAQTQRDIAGVHASPQVDQWASERGWRAAGLSDFDEVGSGAATTLPASAGEQPQ